MVCSAYEHVIKCYAHSVIMSYLFHYFESLVYSLVFLLLVLSYRHIMQPTVCDTHTCTHR